MGIESQEAALVDCKESFPGSPAPLYRPMVSAAMLDVEEGGYCEAD